MGCRLKIGRGPLLGKALEFFSAQGSHAVSGQRSLLEAWTSAIEVDVLASGALVNRRMDLLVGSFSRGMPVGLPSTCLRWVSRTVTGRHNIPTMDTTSVWLSSLLPNAGARCSCYLAPDLPLRGDTVWSVSPPTREEVPTCDRSRDWASVPDCHAGLHLSMWGEVDPKSDKIDMWLGIPAASLSQLGIRGHSREAMLPIRVQGSLQSPTVRWVE